MKKPNFHQKSFVKQRKDYMSKKVGKTKDITAQLALGVSVFIACIESEVIPSKKSPCFKKMKEIYMAYRKRNSRLL